MCLPCCTCFFWCCFWACTADTASEAPASRELVFSFAIASLLTNGIIYFVMSLIARELLNPLYECGAMAVQWVVETILYIFIRITDPKINPDIPALYVRGPGQADRALAGQIQQPAYPVHGAGDAGWGRALAPAAGGGAPV